MTAPNILGILFGLYYVMSTYSYAGKAQKYIAAIVYGTTFAFASLLIGFRIYSQDHTAHFSKEQVTKFREIGAEYLLVKNIMGGMCTLVLVLFYVSPLAEVASMIKNRDASKINAPLAITAIFNSGFWVAYGRSIENAWVWGPNACGAVFSVFQLILLLAFRNKKPASPSQQNLTETPKV